LINNGGYDGTFIQSYQTSLISKNGLTYKT